MYKAFLVISEKYLFFDKLKKNFLIYYSISYTMNILSFIQKISIKMGRMKRKLLSVVKNK